MKCCLKERRVTIGMIIILVIIAAFVFGATTAAADSGRRVNERKFFTSYVVRSEDTLWDIAVEHITPEYTDIQEYIREIMDSNQMETADIYPGQLLVIPYYSDSPLYGA